MKLCPRCKTNARHINKNGKLMAYCQTCGNERHRTYKKQRYHAAKSNQSTSFPLPVATGRGSGGGVSSAHPDLDSLIRRYHANEILHQAAQAALLRQIDRLQAKEAS